MKKTHSEPFRLLGTVLLAAAAALSLGAAQAQNFPQRGPFPGQAGGRLGGIPPGQPGSATSSGTPGNSNVKGFVPPGIELVAGVRLDRPAEMPAGLTDLHAVAWDAGEKRLYLVGQHSLRLPALKTEDLAVALKGDAYPAVSIEGPMTKGRMTVKYYGGTENTQFGQALFEADRLLKSLALGIDNLTKRPLRPNVPGYESEVEKLRRMGGAQRPKAWHRYWFRPARVTTSISEDGKALRFDDVKMEVRTEYVPAITSGESEPAAEEFAQQFTEHYDEYAAIYPVLAQLKELTKVEALAEWLKESGIPTESLGLDKAVIPEFATTKTTPIGFVEKLALTPEGLWKHQMEGGVSLRIWRAEPPADGQDATAEAGNWTVVRGGSAPDLLKSVLKRPSAEAGRWFAGYRSRAGSATANDSSR